MHKLCFASCLALIVGSLTLIISFLSDVTLSTTFYRVMVSLGVFGIIGYIIAIIVEKYFKPGIETLNSKGQKIDIISKDEPIAENNGNDNSFVAFTPDNLERISTLKD